jgi:hypothetical protein
VVRAVAVDGTTARGAARGDGTRAALFSMVEHDTGIPPGQVEITTTGEIASFATVLDRIDLRALVVTADALHTHKTHVHDLHLHGGHDLFLVTGHQPTCQARRAGLAWTRAPAGQHGTGHGRRECRTVQIVSAAAP